MKKAISTSFYGEGNPNNHVSFLGCLDTVKWKSVEYDGGPKESGIYVVTDGKGIHTILSFTTNGDGYNEDDKWNLFKRVLDDQYSLHIWDGSVNRHSPTDSDILDLARDYGIWYRIDEEFSYGEFSGYKIIRYVGDAIPKYYLDINLEGGKVGPIDEELDSYEEEETDWEKW